jgi:hypothetical protein
LGSGRDGSAREPGKRDRPALEDVDVVETEESVEELRGSGFFESFFGILKRICGIRFLKTMDGLRVVMKFRC